MADGIIEGMERRRLPGAGLEIDVLVGGSGPPLLCLHGWPQTRMIWKAAAPRLMERFTLVAPDLRGYGRSQGAPGYEEATQRHMADDQVAVMRALGHDRFRVLSHDRGARVGYRLALDHPATVERLAVLDIVPTVEVWDAMDARQSVAMFHWALQAQPAEFATRLIGADPAFFLRWILSHQSAPPGFDFDAEAMADYAACARDPAVVKGWCDDYRAGWKLDRDLDAADRGAGRRIACPVLALWGEHGSFKHGGDPLGVWKRWADDVQGRQLPGGHFVPEEATDEMLAKALPFFA